MKLPSGLITELVGGLRTPAAESRVHRLEQVGNLDLPLEPIVAAAPTDISILKF
jgi:hypothetical protein